MLKTRTGDLPCSSCGAAPIGHPKGQRVVRCTNQRCFFSEVWVPCSTWNRRVVEDRLATQLYEVAKNKNIDHPGLAARMAAKAEASLLSMGYTIMETSRAPRTEDSSE